MKYKGIRIIPKDLPHNHHGYHFRQAQPPLGNGRGFHTLQGLRVRVPGGQGGGPGVWTLIPLYPRIRIR